MKHVMNILTLERCPAICHDGALKDVMPSSNSDNRTDRWNQTIRIYKAGVQSSDDQEHGQGGRKHVVLRGCRVAGVNNVESRELALNTQNVLSM